MCLAAQRVFDHDALLVHVEFDVLDYDAVSEQRGFENEYSY